MNILNVEKVSLPTGVKNMQKLTIDDFISLDKISKKDNKTHLVASKKNEEPEEYPGVIGRNFMKEHVYTNSNNPVISNEYKSTKKLTNPNLQFNNINITNVSDKSSLRNASLHKNLNKFKNNNSRLSFSNTNNITNNFFDLSQNFSINVENNANNVVSSGHNYYSTHSHQSIDENNNLGNYMKTGDKNTNHKGLSSGMSIHNVLQNIIIVYKIHDEFLVPMQVIKEEENLITLKYVRLNIYIC